MIVVSVERVSRRTTNRPIHPNQPQTNPVMTNQLKGRERRTATLAIKLTPREKELIKENADKCGLNVTEYILALCVRPTETITITEPTN